MNLYLKWNVKGWGTINEGGPTPDKLKNVRVSIYSNNLCDFVLPVKKNHLSQICAGIYWLYQLKFSKKYIQNV